ncbi:hypothetical protein ACFSTC_42000 [Nonomuraea ferruginea]
MGAADRHAQVRQAGLAHAARPDRQARRRQPDDRRLPDRLVGSGGARVPPVRGGRPRPDRPGDQGRVGEAGAARHGRGAGLGQRARPVDRRPGPVHPHQPQGHPLHRPGRAAPADPGRPERPRG